MKKPWLEEGATYGYDEKGNRHCRGSMMGRRIILPDDPEASIKLRMEHLRFVDGCYDQGGAYWGAPCDLYCAYGEEGVQVFVRAINRQGAKNKVRESIPGARFFN